MRARSLASAAIVLAALAAAAVPVAAADAVPNPCDGPNEAVIRDVMDTLDDPTHPECGSLTDPCYKEPEWGCGGCGPDLVEWVIGPIYCP
jgi:hypothetical protein